MARQAASQRTETEAMTATEETGQATAGRGAARRTVVAAVGAAGLTAALAACGGSMEDAGSGNSKAEGGGQAGSSGASGGDAAGGGGGTILAKTSEIPKGGGKIFKADKVVVTQPQDGDIKAFSAICTHAGCVVGEVSGGTINCMCHGSKFDITDGSVKKGPATKGLAPAKVNVKGGSVALG
ncbi:Ferredoxin subunit of nitrite reductase or a ring-hydroxylating dioxygenase [Streptomyces sp. 2112.3]|nr:nitrite reductase/ring-hydroxylating ferredoxin subunit [Streptomyces sp. 2321.6]SDR56893.1 Ferredoxin subunit of nitrite reductase or a ring-hydroxylating dioxygenase [Streptomyces sp. KS_16]SEB94454.1 Ferredoxin subunit of nitrite reductase or a ring-hydroxylating dioxygenase [Streptomyces sp. 2133.1]SEF11821.1 Ferredoxin subunit of nitrite reductase or a ring-hydroxylating dioxygenase [Streptomyces sp. 2112.3]SNC62884.1 Ferredoxin subunit of nitrite reductase or a ring-hydroxylating dioxy